MIFFAERKFGNPGFREKNNYSNKEMLIRQKKVTYTNTYVNKSGIHGNDDGIEQRNTFSLFYSQDGRG